MYVYVCVCLFKFIPINLELCEVLFYFKYNWPLSKINLEWDTGGWDLHILGIVNGLAGKLFKYLLLLYLHCKSLSRDGLSGQTVEIDQLCLELNWSRDSLYTGEDGLAREANLILLMEKIGAESLEQLLLSWSGGELLKTGLLLLHLVVTELLLSLYG